MSDQNADWESSIAMSASDLTFVEAASSSAVFDDSADLCESSEGSLFNASSVDGDSIDDFNEDNGAYVPLLEEQSAQVDSLREVLRAQCAQHANEVAKLERDLHEAHLFIHTQFGDMKRMHEEEMRRTKAEHDAQYTELMQKYKAAGKQLATAQSQTQGIFQDLTDERLVQKVLTLRQTVKAFALLFQNHFVYEGGQIDSLRWSAKEIRQVALFGHPFLRDNMPIIPVSMQAYIWHIVVKRVSNRFRWAGGDAEALQRVLCRFDKSQKKDGDVQALRQMEIWKATTASLLLGPTASQSEMTSNADAAHQIHRAIIRICEAAFPPRLFHGFKDEDRDRYRSHVYHIIEQAVKLDLEICKQGAGILWEFGDVVGCMDHVHPSDKAEATDPEAVPVRVITAPALMKLGKSNGEDLDLEPRVLLQGEDADGFAGSKLVRVDPIWRDGTLSMHREGYKVG